MNYPRYHSYEHSSVVWLGEIPNNWNKKRLKYLISETVKDGPHETPDFINDGYPFLSVDNIQDGKLIFEGCRFVSAEDHRSYSRKCSPKKNDLLIGKAASTGKIALINVNFEFGIWSPLALVRLDSKKAISKYIYYSLLSTPLQDQIDNYCNSNTQKNIAMSDIPLLLFPLPPLPEQQAIAAFLDRQTAKIDALIEKYQRLIQLLQEKRTALITHAVTRGLDPNVPLKDSGVGWLGEIPYHWVIKRSRYIFKIKNGSTPKSTEESYWGGEIVWITPEDLGKNTNIYINIGEKSITQDGYHNCGAEIVPKGSIVLSTRAPIGHLAIAEIELSTNQGCKSLVKIKDDNSHYFYYLFLSLKPILNSLGKGTTFLELGKNELQDLIITNPPLPEQQAIATFLDRETAKIDNTVSKIESLINKLQEYRSALITAAVTGKIDTNKVK